MFAAEILWLGGDQRFKLNNMIAPTIISQPRLQAWQISASSVKSQLQAGTTFLIAYEKLDH